MIKTETDKLTSLIEDEQEQITQQISKDEVNNYALVLKNISKVFHSPAGRTIALDDINFAVKKGEFVSITGPSGSGKSTLLNMIGGLDKPSFGKVLINDIDVFLQKDSKIAEIRNERIGFVFQSYNLINRMTVQENVEFPGILMSNDDKDSENNMERIHSRSKALLDGLGIGDKYKMKSSDLSGGQQQRVAIARALINNPAILLADEPLGSLDSRTGLDIFNLFKMISKKYETTIVMVTHNIELANQTDRSIYLKDGKIEKEIINK
jgi:putative ABC transport system ATP-binding protein